MQLAKDASLTHAAERHCLPAAGAFAAAAGAAAVCAEGVEGAAAAAAEPATLTPLPLLKPSKLEGRGNNVQPTELWQIQMMLWTVAAPVLKPLVDVVVPSAGVRVLPCVWRLLNLGEHDQVVL